MNAAKEEIEKKVHEHGKLIETLNEQYRKQAEFMKQTQRDIQETKNSIESMQNRLKEAEDRILDLEDRITVSDQERIELLKITKQHEMTIQKLHDDAKSNNIRIMGISEDTGVQANDIHKVFTEIIAENFPNMGKESDMQISEAYRTPNSHNQHKSTPRHIIIKISDIQHKNRILKAVREKTQLTYQGKPIRIMADFSAQTLKSRRAWNEVFQSLKENNFQPRLMYPAKLSFKFNGETRYFHDKEQLKKFMSTKPTLERVLKDILDRDKNDHNPQNNNRKKPPGRISN